MDLHKTCSHTKLDGNQCRMFALSGKRYCHYHERYSNRNTTPKTKNNYALVPFEDTRSVVFVINQLIYSFLNDLIEESKFTKTIYALQVAAQYINRPDALSPDALLEIAEQQEAEQQQAAQQEAEQVAAEEKPKEERNQLVQLLIDSIADLQAGQRDDNDDNHAGSKMKPSGAEAIQSTS